MMILSNESVLIEYTGPQPFIQFVWFQIQCYLKLGLLSLVFIHNYIKHNSHCTYVQEGSEALN